MFRMERLGIAMRRQLRFWFELRSPAAEVIVLRTPGTIRSQKLRATITSFRRR
jgi:hypothetical protein